MPKPKKPKKPRECRTCGCTEANACTHPLVPNCSWFLPDLCDYCAALAIGLEFMRDDPERARRVIRELLPVEEEPLIVLASESEASRFIQRVRADAAGV